MRDQLNLFSLAPHRPERSDLIVDCFAGGGGASLGITQALGRPVDIAINHSRQAIALHAKNHPDTDHYCEDIWTVEPKAATKGKPVSLLWASPDCRHFSRAKGGKPASPRVRSLAWVVVTWARRVRPRLICLENVEEFQTWGPLHEDGSPDKERQGQTFRRWASHLRNLGYALEYRSLRACDYGAPTTRRRLFIVARCDGHPIVWPTPTHGPGRAHPHRTAAECIDWSIPVPSIFGRKKPLAEATEARIAAGIKKFVLDREPFIVPIRSTWAPDAEDVLVAPTLIQTGYGEREGQAPRVLDLHKPLGTAVAGGQKHALVYAFLARHYGGVVGRSLTEPMSTVTTIDHHSLVTALLVKYYGNGGEQGVNRPLDTVTTKDRFALVTVHGVPHRIMDIGMRMLTPRELARAQGFPDDYSLDATCLGDAVTRTDQTRMIGNSVCPPVARALIEANLANVITTRHAA
jgi:DNA (cytosine-5)-methyltransferase 1